MYVNHMLKINKINNIVMKIIVMKMYFGSIIG